MGLCGNGIEVGAAAGKYSRVILNNSHLLKFYMLDVWEVMPKEEFPSRANYIQMIRKRYDSAKNVAIQFQNRAVILKKNSREAFKDFEDNFFDFIYIDASHVYKYVKQDIENWYPKVKTGGVFSGHDYMNSERFCGVVQAVDEFCSKIDMVPIVIPGSRRCPQSWYCIKK
jgi:hypothetical protein